MSFGSRLRDKRNELNITQPQLAKMLGVSQSAVGKQTLIPLEQLFCMICLIFYIVMPITYFKMKQGNYIRMKLPQKNLKSW